MYKYIYMCVYVRICICTFAAHNEGALQPHNFNQQNLRHTLYALHVLLHYDLYYFSKVV